MMLALVICSGLSPAPAHAISGKITEPVSADLRDIIPFISNAVEASPGNAGMHFSLGTLYMLAGEGYLGITNNPSQFEQAEHEFKQALKLAPSMYLAHYHLGLLEIHRKNMSKAAAHLLDALAMNKMDVRVHKKLHTIYYFEDEYKSAALVLKNALELFPSDAELHYRLAVTYMVMKLYAEARDSATASIRYSYTTMANNIRAIANFKLKDYSAAESVFKNTLRRAPDNLDAMTGLSRVYAETYRVKEARSMARHILTIDPGNTEAKEILKALKAEAGQQ